MSCALLVFCNDLAKDPVASHVLEKVLEANTLTETALVIDGLPVLQKIQGNDMFYIMRTEVVLSHDYMRYAQTINEHFSDVDVVITVNWHEGSKAPNSIFTIQTIGDMQSGVFSPINPKITYQLYKEVELERKRLNLDAFTTWMEATHWSGVVFGEQPGQYVGKIKPSVLDLEIGSSVEDWSNPVAAQVIANAVFKVFNETNAAVFPILFIGGVHFEPSLTDMVRNTLDSKRVAASHILPNHWLVANGYDSESRLEDLGNCVSSIEGGIECIVFHDNLKGIYKDNVKKLSSLIGKPAYNHKQFRKLVESE